MFNAFKHFFSRGNRGLAPIPKLRHEVSMWKYHLSLIMGDIAMEKAPMDDGEINSFDDFFAMMNKVDMLKCWELNLEMSCEAMKDEHAYRQAPAIITTLVGLFVSYTGHEIAKGYPLCESSRKNKNAFLDMCMKMTDIVQQSIIAMGPDALDDDTKITLLVFYAYLCGIERKKTMNDIHCVLSMLSVEFSNAIDGVNFCVSHLYDYNHVYGPNPYCLVRNLTRPGSKSFDTQDFETFNVYDKVSSLFHEVRAFKREEKAKAKKEAIAYERRKAAEEAELKRKKKRRQKAAKLERKREESEESRKKKQDLWEKTRQERKEKKRLYRKAELEKAEVEEAQRQQEIEAHRRLRLERYFQKVRKEQEERRLMRNVLKQAHVLSPSRKREEKIRRREQQEDTHAVWRAQKKKHKLARK